MVDELLDLARRLPPWQLEEHMARIVDCLGGPYNETADQLLSSVDQPLKVLVDGSGREFLACDFNRDSAEVEDDGQGSGDAHRSPWTNEYIPPIPSGTVPSTKLRNLEQAANDAFAVYREMYYEGTGISSVYLWDLEDSSGTSFAGVVLLKKTSKGGDGQTSGAWDSIHVFEASEKSRQGTYKLTSTIMLYMNKAGSETLGDLTLGGSMTRQMEQSYPLDTTASYATTSTSINPSHISNIGRMIEDQEIKMRGLLQDVYFAKTRDVVNDIRILRGAGEESKRKGLQGELVGLLRGRA